MEVPSLGDITRIVLCLCALVNEIAVFLHCELLLKETEFQMKQTSFLKVITYIDRQRWYACWWTESFQRKNVNIFILSRFRSLLENVYALYDRRWIISVIKTAFILKSKLVEIHIPTSKLWNSISEITCHPLE